MKKIILTLILMSGTISFIYSTSAIAAPEAAAVADAGNKFCPVSGDKVSDKVEKVEYKGKRYRLCCPMCANKFRRDPEKYLATLKG